MVDSQSLLRGLIALEVGVVNKHFEEHLMEDHIVSIFGEILFGEE